MRAELRKALPRFAPRQLTGWDGVGEGVPRWKEGQEVKDPAPTGTGAGR